jgi:hypothetical protein
VSDRELAFGEGVALPTRLRFKEVPVHQLPRSEASISTARSPPRTLHHVTSRKPALRGGHYQL